MFHNINEFVGINLTFINLHVKNCSINAKLELAGYFLLFIFNKVELLILGTILAAFHGSLWKASGSSL